MAEQHPATKVDPFLLNQRFKRIFENGKVYHKIKLGYGKPVLINCGIKGSYRPHLDLQTNVSFTTRVAICI